MSSPQSEAALQAAAQTRRLQEGAYGLAFPALSKEYGVLNQALATGGEPEFIRSAYEGARGGIRAGAARQGEMALQANLAQNKGSLLGGNVGVVAPPDQLGTAMARALYGPRVSEASGQIEQLNKLYGMGIGQAQQTGSGALTATGNELANIGMMQPYNSTYATILGALNLGSSIYGAYGQGARANPYASINAGQGWNVGGLSGIGGT